MACSSSDVSARNWTSRTIIARSTSIRRANPNAPSDTEMLDPKAKERIPPKYNLKTQLKAEVKKGAGNTFDFRLD